MHKFTIILGIWLMGFSPSWAVIEHEQFETSEQSQLYQTLLQELRCTVCQNQNIAESNAPLAKDLRQQTAKLVRQDLEKTEILDFMVTRYGEFVLYKPPVQSNTLLLWLGPLLFLLLGGFILHQTLKHNQKD